MKFFRKRTFTVFWFLLPSIVFITGLMLFPMLNALNLSTQNYYLGRPWDRGFIGLANYTKALLDPTFWQSLKNSAIWVGGCVSLQFVFGLFLAMLLNQKFFGRGLYRALVLSPWVVSGTVASIVWLFMLQSEIGVINDLLIKIGVINFGIPWLSRRGTAMLSIIQVNIWRGIPFFGIMILAALQGIPNELYEASNIDGATKWQQFVHITCPLIKDMVITATILRIIWTFNVVDVIFLMTGGGPADATQTLAILIYNQGMKISNFGYGSALSMIMLVFLLVFTFFYVRIGKLGREEIR